MNRIITLVTLLILTLLPLSAQTYMGRLTSTEAGKGKVTVTQDQRLTDIINGNGPKASASSTGKTTSTAVTASSDKDDVLSQPTGKKTKVRGFRIQIFWGGSLKTDKTKAQAAGNRVSNLFPELPVYTSFESPHWRCRVGDFVDRKEAYDCLVKLRQAGIAEEGMIVKSEIYVYQ